MRGTSVRVLLVGLFVVLASIAVPLVAVAQESTLVGLLDCGARSGQKCALGGTLTLVIDPGYRVEVSLDWIDTSKLDRLDQDDLLEVDVQKMPNGQYVATAIRNVSDRNGVQRPSHASDQQHEDDDASSPSHVPNTSGSGAGPGAPAALSPVSGNGGTATVGSQRTLQIRLADSAGQPIPGATIGWTVATGGGSLSAPTSTTDANGIATVVWTIGPIVGPQSVTATLLSPTALRDGDLMARVALGSVDDWPHVTDAIRVSSPDVAAMAPLSTTFTVTATAGTASRLVFVTQPSTVAVGATISPAVRVTIQDAGGNTVTNAATTITIGLGTNPGGGTLSGTTSVAAVNGVATFSNVSIDKVGAGYTLTASAPGLTGATSAAFNVTPGGASKLAFIVQPTTTQAGRAITPAVQVAIQDASGNTLTGATNTVTLVIGTNPGGGTLSGTTSVAAINGVATFSTLSIDKPGAGYTLAASASGLAGATSSTFTVTAGAAHHLAFVQQPTSVAAGATISPAVMVQVLDQLNNPVTTATSTITLAIGTNPGGGTLSGTLSVAAVSGVATFSTLSIDKVGTGYTLTASAPGLNSATSSTFTIAAGAAHHLGFTVQPSNVTAGASMAPAVQVTVFDSANNVATNAGNLVTLAFGVNAGSGTLTGGGPLTPVNGVATFSGLSIDKVGTGYTLTASASGATGATSTAFNVIPGAASKLAFTVQPSNTAGGASITPAVQIAIQDTFGNTVTGATDNVTVAIGTNPGSGTLSGTTTVTAVAGVATFSALSIDKVGTGYTLTASAGALTGATSTTFNITLGAASRLAFTVQPSNATAGTGIGPVQVTIQDAGGNTVTSATGNVTVAIGTNPGSGTLSGTATVVAVNGIATFSNLSINKSGTGYTLTASAGGLTSATSATFNITFAAPHHLGFLQQPVGAVVGAAISPSVTVQILDSFNNVVTSDTSTVTIAIGANPGGGTLSGTTSVAAVSGVATFSNLSIDQRANGYTLTASDGFLTGTTSTSFNITNAPHHLSFVQQPTSTQAGTVISPAVKVQILDQFNNLVASDTSIVTIAIGTNPSSGTLSGTTSVAAVGGVATFSNLSIDQTGVGYTLTATDGALTGATSASFSIT